jgi:hypothetical protein
MTYISITPSCHGYRIEAQLTGGHRSRIYIGYTRAQAIRQARRDYGLVGKHLEIIDY